jgi:hypothetical protein
MGLEVNAIKDRQKLVFREFLPVFLLVLMKECIYNVSVITSNKGIRNCL